MAPDVEELIRRVNTLTLDKNRMKQKLTQLTNGQNGKDAIIKLNNQISSLQQQSSKDSLESSPCDSHQSPNSISGFKLTNSTNRTSPSSNQSNSNNSSATSTIPPHGGSTTTTTTNGSNIIAGVECASSCEEDMLYMNELYRKRLDEYNENWEYIQSKCSALLSELNALQAHYARLKREKLELEEKYRSKCEDCDDIKSELQTVVLNYETQLSAMSDHLSSITRQISPEDNPLGRPTR